jgi:hypothetical protein
LNAVIEAEHLRKIFGPLVALDDLHDPDGLRILYSTDLPPANLIIT